MDLKLFGILFICLAMLGTVFAASPSVTITTPATNASLVPGNYVLDFNVIDYNSTASSRAVVPQLKLYYSTTAGAYQNLIVWDTNLNNATGIVCADANFVNTTNCTYTWTIPTTVVPDNYYLDYNLMDNNETAPYTFQYYTGSSGSFKIQLLPAGSATSGCGLIAWIAPLFGILLAFFVLMQLMAGKFSPALVSIAIGGVIGIVIMWAFSAAICVV